MTLLGLGTAPIYAGGFIAAPLYAAGNSPISVAAGDFDRDGISDLAVVNQKPSYSTDPDTISVLLGNGDGTFAGPFSYAVDSNPTSLTVGDFNGDGIADLAVTNVSGTLSVLLGNGDGTFQPPRRTPAAIYSLQLGDFNGDGILDLAGLHGTDVRILLGNGHLDHVTRPTRNESWLWYH